MDAATFIDTGYVLALANTADKYHERAYAASLLVEPPFFTTEAVLIEIGNALSGLRWRSLGFAVINDLRQDPNITILSVDTDLFDRALSLYGARSDKTWGITDCISFIVMQTHNLHSVLTTDRHFEQAGFQNLLV